MSQSRCPKCGEHSKSKFPPKHLSRYANHWNIYHTPLCLYCSGVNGRKFTPNEKGAISAQHAFSFCHNPYVHELDGCRIQAWYDLKNVKTKGPAMRAVRQYLKGSDSWRASLEFKKVKL